MTARVSGRATLVAAVTLILAAAELPEASAKDVYEVDGVHSHVGFHIQHFGAGHVYGRFNSFSGTVVVSGDKLTQGHVAIEIDAASIDTGNAKRDGHLKGPDFFNVKQFPKITFEATGVKPTGDSSLEVEGKLFLHGVEKTVKAQVTLLGHGPDPRGTMRVGYEATFTIKRSEFGINYMPGGIGDEVHIVVAVEGVKK